MKKATKYFIIYKTTCIINNRIYIGQHRTNKLNDGYLGSGYLLRDDIKKFGKDKFKREILFYCVNAEELDKKEQEIVNEDFVQREDTYNCKLGGQTDLDENFNSTWSEAGHRGFKKKFDENENFRNEIIAKHREISIKINTAQYLKLYQSGPLKKKTFLGKCHKDESKIKIGKANAIHQKGKGNSNYGKCWIYNFNLKQNKSIPKNELDQWLNKGWTKGRKMIFKHAVVV